MLTHNRGSSVFIASALGVALGGFIAHSLSTTWWWLGLFAGGILAFVAYDPKKAWEMCKPGDDGKAQIKEAALFTANLLALFADGILFGYVLLFLYGVETGEAAAISFCAGLGLAFLGSMALLGDVGNQKKGVKEPIEQFQLGANLYKKALLFVTPPLPLFWIVYGVAKVIIFLGQVLFAILYKIYEEERLTSAMGAVIGTAVAHSIAEPLPGILTGAIVGSFVGWASHRILAQRLLPIFDRLRGKWIREF